jgi:DNA-binding CsgD family transcriptional regulator
MIPTCNQRAFQRSAISDLCHFTRAFLFSRKLFLIAPSRRPLSHATTIIAPSGARTTMRTLDEYELKALALFASGKSADEMAAALGISRSMAQHYLRIAARKLGARNRVHAVAIAVRNGLIEPSGGDR